MVDVAMDMDPFGVVIVVGGVSAVPPNKTRRERTCELKLGLSCGLNLPLDCSPIHVFSHPLQTPSVASPAPAHRAMQPLPCGTSSLAMQPCGALVVGQGAQRGHHG